MQTSGSLVDRFDARIVGIWPDLGVEVRQDLLEKIDGPMLRYGIQGLHGGRLMIVPDARSERPDRHRLEWAYDRFRVDAAAG